jgi:hypothetical protein
VLKSKSVLTSIASTALLASITLLAALTTQASAEILFEPSISEQVGGTFRSSPDPDSTFNGMAYGGRVGVRYTILSLGAEYLANSNLLVNVPAGNSITGTSPTALSMSARDVGAFIAFNTMLGSLRATYIFSGSARATHKSAQGQTDIDLDYTGTGYKIGASMKIASFLAIGVDYLNVTYNKSKDHLRNGLITNLSPKDTLSAILFSISLPIEFGFGGSGSSSSHSSQGSPPPQSGDPRYR